MKFKSCLIALAIFVHAASAIAATCCSQPTPQQAERDKIYGLTSLAVIYKDWVSNSSGRGHNIGSVLVRNSDNVPVFYARNSVNVRHNSSQHGEVRTIQAFLDYCRASTSPRPKYVDEYTVYTTLEPCAMCTGMMAMTKLTRAVFVQIDPEFGRALRGLQLVKFPRVFTQNTTPGLQQKIDLENGWVAYRRANPGSAITDYLLSDDAKSIYATAESAISNYNVIYPENAAVKDAAIAFIQTVGAAGPEVFESAMAARCP